MGNGPFYQDALRQGEHPRGAPVPRRPGTWRTDGRVIAGLVHLAPVFLGPLFIVSLAIHLISRGDKRPLVTNAAGGVWRFTLKAVVVLILAVFGPLLAGRTDLVGPAAATVVGLWALTNLLAAVWTWTTGRTFRYPLDGLSLRSRRRGSRRG
ncbi:hypothetical protein JNB_10304 [Janibacter sp. HTCC2649]|uniref:DUF4870 domain-containing protein n=1 Tax=Janibacter sp. HTCC2649 TaxID=313589 RepID=UPI0000670BA9|nr:DUF4870 domain-containing protein [Janibacter sp. HTCC2649]EAQ00558.1 hypothetical protein JNB_10304 [Janibacter sp. HTCC2649]